MSSLYYVEYLIKNVLAYIFASRTPAVRVDQVSKKLLGIYSNYLIPFSYIRVNTQFHPYPSKFRGSPSELNICPKIPKISEIYKGEILAVVF